MEQKYFTDYIIPKLVDRFPQFAKCCTVKPNDIGDIDYKSPQGKLTLWITTQDKEITVGFTGMPDCDWHTHMSLFGANTPEEELNAAIHLIHDILNDYEPIIYSNLNGYFLTDDISELGNNLSYNETVQIFRWSEL